MAAAELYQITILLKVTDARALKCAAAELAGAIEMPEWELTSGNTEDQLLMLLDPGTLPGVKIIETNVSRVAKVSRSLS